MRKLKDRLHDLDKNDIQEKWQRLESDGELSTREKLEKLVRHNLKQKEKPVAAAPARPAPATD